MEGLNITWATESGDNFTFSIRFPSPSVTLFSASIEVIFAVLTILGNVLFIMSVFLKKKLRTPAHVYLVNLSTTDIFAAVFVSLPSVDAFLNEGWRLGETFCIIHNLLHPLLLSTSLWLSAFIAVNRYIYVVHKLRYRSFTNKVTVTLSVVYVWCFPAAVRSPGYLSPGFSQYAPPTYVCRGSLSQVITAALIYIPCAIVVVCYSLTFRWVRKMRRQVETHSNHPGLGQSNNKGPSRHVVRMIYALAGIFALILVGYLPFVLLINISASLQVTPDPDASMLLYPLIHVGGVVNPILYGICNRNFRKAYSEILATLCRPFGEGRQESRTPRVVTSSLTPPNAEQALGVPNVQQVIVVSCSREVATNH
ncbi:melatonin receptor type 1A-like [Ptychodera flava]|uniref:melatonin receptor type 1A-like n=1 Tax=Ptychodera flava TaxID=63121 RepID=UPI003969E10E